MHRVESAGIISRLTQLGCVVCRTYSVPSPGALMHIGTNHKLIRYAYAHPEKVSGEEADYSPEETDVSL